MRILILSLLLLALLVSCGIAAIFWFFRGLRRMEESEQ